MSPYRRYPRWDPRRHAVHYLSSVGRRGAVLTILGTLWVLMGIGVTFTPPSEVYVLLSGWAGLRGAAWIVTGLVALVYARKPQGEDAPGFAALYVMLAYRVLAYAAGTINYWLASDLGVGGSARGIVQVLLFAGIMVLLLTVAGWAEPGRDPSADDEGGTP